MDSRNPFDRTIRRIRLLPTLPNSADDALYTVYHKGGTTQFKVNQQMGGGTWIYLGTFGFNAGRNNECKVVLNNLSSKVGRIITADAVKIGGGMGNIARCISEEGATENLKVPIPATSQANTAQPILNSQFSILNSKRKSAVIPVSAKPPATGCNGRHTGQRIFRKQRQE